MSSNRVRASFVAQAMCGVTMQFFADKRGLEAMGGSTESTSSAAPGDHAFIQARPPVPDPPPGAHARYSTGTPNASFA